MSVSPSYVLASVLAVIVAGSANNVVGKVKAKPLGRFNVLAAFLNAFVYTVVYGICTFLRRDRSGVLLSKEEREFLSYIPVQAQLNRSDSEIELTEPLLPSMSKQAQTATSHRLWLTQWWYRLSMLKFFVFIGGMEAVGSIMGLMAQAVITGPLYSLSLQSIIVFSALIGHYALNVKYTMSQVVAMGVVISGACVSVLSQYGISENSMPWLKVATDGPYPPTGIVPSSLGSSLKSSVSDPFIRTILYASIGSLSTLPTAISYATKEHLFLSYELLHPGSSLSIFTVGFLSSLLALCFLPLVLFIQFLLTEAGDTPYHELTQGIRCLLGVTPAVTENDCTWAPEAYAVYIVINVLFNFSLLNLVKVSTSLVTFLSMKAVLPVAIVIFAIVPLPLLEKADTDVSPLVLLGLVLVLSGLALYQKGR